MCTLSFKADFQNNLLTYDWDRFYGEIDPNILWDLMEERILEQANNFCQIKIFRVNALREPWITNEAIEAIRDKDKLLQKARKSGKERDWTGAKEARNRVGRELENLRSDFLKRQQEANKNDLKQIWNSISTVFPGKKGKSSKIWLKNNVNNTEVKQEDTANFINTFFTNIGKDLASQYNVNWIYFGETCQNSIDDFLTDADEVSALCRDINPIKSSGMDKLSSKLCKDAFLCLNGKLTHIFNCSLRSGSFPNKWKIAQILPLFKGGENVNNYRPVSLLPLRRPGKLLKKIVHVSLNSGITTISCL